jgi:hypothetical protein
MHHAQTNQGFLDADAENRKPFRIPVFLDVGIGLPTSKNAVHIQRQRTPIVRVF